MKNKRILIIGVALVLFALVVGVAFAGTGSCNMCSCEKFIYAGENRSGKRVCTCGHRYLYHNRGTDD